MLLPLEVLVPEIGVFCSLGFLGNHELTNLSIVMIIGVVSKGKANATLRTLLGQKCPRRCEFVPEFHDGKAQEREV